MTHLLWTIAREIGFAVRAIFLYFASILKGLSWPQIFLAFLLIFPRQIRNLLITLNKLLERTKTIHWGELKGDLQETSEAVEKAELSKEDAQDKPSNDDSTGQNAPAELTAAIPSRSPLIPTAENASEEYSRFLEEEARLEKELSFLGTRRKRSRRSPIERFLSVSQAIEANLGRLYFLYGLQDPAMPQASSVSRMTAGLLAVGALTEEMYDGFGKYQRLRNRIVHVNAPEAEIIEAFMLGRRLYGLIQSIPLPEYRVVDQSIAVSDEPGMQGLLADVHVVLVENPKTSKRVPFLASAEFSRGTVFVPTSNPNDKLRGYFYFVLDGQLRRIVGQGLELAILYSRD
jgi:hypothetical protein